MLIVAAFALFVVGLLLLFMKLRKLRWFWSVAALLVASAILFAVHVRATNREAMQLNESLVDGCRYLTSELHTIAWNFQSAVVAKEKGVESPVDVLRVRDQYAKVVNSHRDWLQACIPDAARCLPTDLNERTVDKIERVTAAIDPRKSCP